MDSPLRDLINKDMSMEEEKCCRVCEKHIFGYPEHGSWCKNKNCTCHSVSAKEEKDTSWEERWENSAVRKRIVETEQFAQLHHFAPLPYGGQTVQDFILQEREAAKEEEREKSRIEREALLKEILEAVKGLSNEVPTGKVCDYENLDLRIYCDGRDDAFTEVQELIKKKI